MKPEMLSQNPRNFKAWYDSVYPDLMGYGTWLRGGEPNTLDPNEYESREFRVLFTRLSTYFDTGYSFTHQILYQIAAGTKGVFPDLAYLPPRNDLPYFKSQDVPWFLGTQTKFGPEAFDLIGISNSIVQELINLPSFLSNSNIPLKKSERMARTDLPLIILGGANALYSSCIWGEEPLVDGVFVGESDDGIRRMLEIARDGKKLGLTKTQVLAMLEKNISGFFLPENPKSTKKSFIPNLNQSEALEKGPVYYIEDQLGNSHLQISEGCPCFCSFCAESWDRKPYRERGSAQLREVALRAKASMGLDHIDIYSFNFNMHSGLYQILWDLVPHFKGIGLKSQRFDLLAHDPEMVEFQHALEKASLTCGLEGISPRLRKYLHKNLEPEQLHKSLTAIFKSNAREMKIFLIATGLEEEQDFIALEDLIDHIKEVQNQNHSSTRIIFSMTPLVRFPWTPLEFENAPSMARYEKIINKASKKITQSGFEFRESAELPEYWVSQLLVRADKPGITRALLSAVQKTGFIYYRSVTPEFQSVIEQELIQENLLPEQCIQGHTLEESYSKPWAKIETGVKREFLWEEVERARSFVEIDYCLGRSWTKAKCFHCGGCPTRYHVRDIVLSQQKRNYTLDQFKARITAARKEELSIYFEIDCEEKSKGLPRKQLGVMLARAIMLTDLAIAPYYRGYKRSFWSQDEKPVFATGTDYLELVFNRNAIDYLKKKFNDQEFLASVNEKLKGWGECKAIFDFVQMAERFPGTVTIESEFSPDLVPHLKQLGLKYTLKKNQMMSYYEFIPESVKKGILKSLTVEQTGKRYKLRIEPGQKFQVSEFIQNIWHKNVKNNWIRNRVHAESSLALENKSQIKPIAGSFEAGLRSEM